MGLIDRISKYLSSSSSEDSKVYWVYVRCNRCGEQLRSRINLSDDLSIDYQGGNDQTYHSRKTIVGGTGCFERIRVELKFDMNRKLIDRQIAGGEFIEADEYLEEDSSS